MNHWQCSSQGYQKRRLQPLWTKTGNQELMCQTDLLPAYQNADVADPVCVGRSTSKEEPDAAAVAAIGVAVPRRQWQ